MFYAATSLRFHDRDPAGLDTTALAGELQERYTPFRNVPGTYFQESFGHLEGYSAIYYTYMWSLVIAKDLFGVFRREGLLNPAPAGRYRRAILEPGGGAPASKLVQGLHAEFPALTYDFTAKIEHIVRHRELFPEFAATGCVFVVSAVESLSPVVLANLEKGHTRADVQVALEVLRRAGIALRPAFVPFTPWATIGDFLELLEWVAAEGLVDQIDPVQFTIRLLIPPGSLLLSRPGIQPFLDGLDAARFTYRWAHPDPRMDSLQREVSALAEQAARRDEDPAVTFGRIRMLAYARAGRGEAISRFRTPPPERPIPARLTEPWFC